MSKPNKTEQLLAFIRSAPGTPLKRLNVESGLDAKFASTRISQLLKSGRIHGDRLKGYTVADDLPPKQRGFRAEARDARRAARVLLVSKGLPMKAGGRQVGGDHYLKLSIQPWDAMQAWLTPEAFEGFLVGNAIKYLARYKSKGGLVDLRKAGQYLDRVIELVASK